MNNDIDTLYNVSSPSDYSVHEVWRANLELKRMIEVLEKKLEVKQ